MRRHAGPDVLVDDVTGGYGCLCLWGPAAREILQPLTDTSLSTWTSPFMAARRLTVGSVPVLAQRLTFVGESGWELYAPTEYVLTLWDTPDRRRRTGRTPAGRVPGDRGDAVGEGVPGLGLGHHPGDHARRGRSRLRRPDREGVPRAGRVAGRPIGRRGRGRWTTVALPHPRRPADRLPRHGTGPGRTAGPVGRITSGGYGYRVGASIAYAYLPSTVEVGTTVQVGIFGSWRDAVVRAEPLFDPGNERVRR